MRQGRVGGHVDTSGEETEDLESCGSKVSSAAPGDLGTSSLVCLVDSVWLSSAWDLPHPQMQPLRKRRDPFWSIEFISRGGG